MIVPVTVHKLMPDGSTLCRPGASHASTMDRDVSCQSCLKMMATAQQAKDLQTIPPERWP